MKKGMVLAVSMLLALSVFASVAVSADADNDSCFPANTSVAEKEIGLQGIDIIGCKLVKIKDNTKDYMFLAELAIFAGMLALVALFGIVIITRSTRRRK
jgi:hypothetical protein